MEPHTPVVRSTQNWVLHSPAQAPDQARRMPGRSAVLSSSP